MRRIHRIVVLATLTLIAPVLAGCADFDLDKLDVFHLNDKKKLPGKRELLFPNGVPGVSQGIPPEYLKGNQPQDQQADSALAQPGAAPANNANAAKADNQKTAAVTPVETKAKPKPKAKPHTSHKAKPKPKPAPEPAAQQQPQQQTEPWPGTQPQQQPPPGTSEPWPATPPANNSSPWPAPPPSGTFSKQ